MKQKINQNLGIKEGIALLIFSWEVLFIEVLSTRIFAFILWHHFGFMAISVALLGFAGAGSYLSLKKSLPSYKDSIFNAGIFASLSLILSFFIISKIPFSISPSLIVKMLVLYILLAIPFFIWGFVVALGFQTFVQQPGLVYFWNLLGSGVGALSVFFFLSPLGAEKCVLLGAIICLLPSLLYSKNVIKTVSLFSGMFILLCGIIIPHQLFSFRVFQDKILSGYLKEIPQAKREFSAWYSPNRIDIVDTPVSATIFKGAVKIKALFQDGHAPAVIFNPAKTSFPDTILSRTSWAVAYWPDFHPQKVLVIGSGGGIDLQVADYWGAKQIIGIEVNQGLIELLKSRYDNFTGGIFHKPNIKLINSEGRHWLKSTKEKYDLIQLAGVDTWSEISSGAYTLVESYLYTVESFKDYYQHLTPEGRVCISRYLMIPPRESLRLCVLAIKALKELGIKYPANHILAISHCGIFSIIIQKNPISSQQIVKLKKWIETQDWHIKVKVPLFRIYLNECTPRILWHPGMKGGGLYAQLFTKSLRNKEDEFIKNYPFDITPVRDDNPYFFKYSLIQLRLPKFGILVGQLVILAQVFQGIIFGSVLILMPWRKLRKTETIKLNPSWYFASLGFAYLFIEIVLIQKLTLTLGHPFYAIGIVIPALLGFSGLGSLSLDKFWGKISPKIIFTILLILLVLYLFLNNKVLNEILPLPFPLRIMGCLAYLLPLGFLMGIPFPLGLKHFAGSNQKLVPWFWTINGVCSVIASCSVVLISMHLGFSWVWVCALGFYLLAFIFIWK